MFQYEEMRVPEIAHCPLAAVGRRLRDALTLWGDTRALYFDPDRFRLSLNNTIQTLRNVTFVLQKAKNALGDFDSWYTPWQDKMKSDKLMRWLIDSRNLIVKQGDLKMHSRARVSVITSWFEPPKLEMDIDPFIETSQTKAALKNSTPEGFPLEVGILHIERRWIDSRQPETEILEILSHALHVLSQLLYDAHMCLIDKNIREQCPWFASFTVSQEKLAPFLLGQEWDRSIWVDLHDGSILTPLSFESYQTRTSLLNVVGRYPKARLLASKLKDINGFQQESEAYFEQAKHILETDGHHMPMAVLGYPGGTKTVVGMRMNNRTEKHLLIRQIANQIEKTGATSVMLINEVWGSQNSNFQYAVDDPNRREALQLIAANSDGALFVHTALFNRDEQGRISVTSKTVSTIDTVNILEPIRNAWARRREKLEHSD